MVPGALKGHVPTFPDEYFSCQRFPIFVFHIQRNPNTRVKIAFSETIGKRKKEENIANKLTLLARIWLRIFSISAIYFF